MVFTWVQVSLGVSDSSGAGVVSSDGCEPTVTGAGN